LRLRFTCELSPQTGALAIHIGAHEGRYPTWWNEIAVEIDGFATKSSSATIDGKRVEITPGDQKVTIQAPDHGQGMELVIHP
jgi:alpha-glucosidase